MTTLCTNYPCRRPVYAKSECRPCYSYRWSHGEARPQEFVMRNRQKRRTYVAPSNTRVEEQHRRITARQQREPDTEELCGVCGNVRMWVRGETFPLCGQHRAVVALVGLITQDEEDLAGLRRLVTA